MNFAGGDEWDDSELIKAYDKAVKNWRKSKKSSDDGSTAGGGGEPSTSSIIGPWLSVNTAKKQEVIEANNNNLLAVGSWVLGSPCRSVWTQDGLEYEAKIVAIEGPRCTIRFVGYGNQELKNITDLKVTFGKRSRDRQRREANVSNSQYLTAGGGLKQTGGGIGHHDEDYFSSVSLTSSMCNNCPSVRNDDQLTSTTNSSIFQSPRKKDGSPGKRKRDTVEVDSMMSVDTNQQDLQDPSGLEAVPSAAEATQGSSSSSSDISEDDNEDGDDEATSGGRAFGESFKTFPQMCPQFPVPPMPSSLSDENGKFDFGRGQLPSLLLSWYMTGYHAGYFDANQTKNKSQNQGKNKDDNPTTSTKSRPKHQ